MIDELKNIKSDSSFIPEGCASFVEEATFIIGAIDEDYDELMESLSLSEGDECAPETEPDTEPVEDTNESAVVTEKFDPKAAGSSIVEFLKKIWAKIKAAFEKVIKWIGEQVKNAKAKGLDKLAAKWDKVEFKADAKLGSFHASKKLGDTKWMSALTKKAVGTDAFVDNGGNANLGAIPSKVLKSVGISAGNEVSVKDMRKALKDYFLSEDSVIAVTGSNIGSVKSDVLAILNGGQKAEVKSAYNEARKVINGLIDEAKSAKKEAKGTDDAKSAKKEAAQRANVARRFGQVLGTGVGVQLDCVRKQFSEAAGIALRVKAKLSKKEEKKEEAASESVDIFAW
jgi:hypothetical protein